MGIPRFPADGGIALRGIALFLERLQNRGALRLFIQKPRQLLEADAVHIMRRNFPILIQHDHIADRQAVPMVVQRAVAVEFLVQLFQQLRLRNAALSFREVAPVQNLVIFNGRSDVLLIQIAHGGKAQRRVCIEKIYEDILDGICDAVDQKVERLRNRYKYTDKATFRFFNDFAKGVKGILDMFPVIFCAGHGNSPFPPKRVVHD